MDSRELAFHLEEFLDRRINEEQEQLPDEVPLKDGSINSYYNWYKRGTGLSKIAAFEEVKAVLDGLT